MIISIEIKDSPKGYNIPKRGPLFLPISADTLVLIGECWTKAIYEVFEGGRYWIYTNKRSDNKRIEPTTKDVAAHP